MFFFIVHPAIAPAKRVATHFPCWNRSCPFAELVWITGGCSNPCFCQKPEKIYFPGSKWIAGNILCICCFFPIPEDVFILCIGFFYRFREMFLRPKLSILYSMYPIGIIYIYVYSIYTRVFAHICTTWRGKHSNCWNVGKNNFKGNSFICGNAGRKQFQGETFQLLKCLCKKQLEGGNIQTAERPVKNKFKGKHSNCWNAG